MNQLYFSSIWNFYKWFNMINKYKCEWRQVNHFQIDFYLGSLVAYSIFTKVKFDRKIYWIVIFWRKDHGTNFDRKYQYGGFRPNDGTKPTREKPIHFKEIFNSVQDKSCYLMFNFLLWKILSKTMLYFNNWRILD